MSLPKLKQIKKLKQTRRLYKKCILDKNIYQDLIKGVLRPLLNKPAVTGKKADIAEQANSGIFNIYYQKNNVVVALNKNELYIEYEENESSKDAAFVILREILRRGGKELSR